MKLQPKFDIGDEVYAVYYDSSDKNTIGLRRGVICSVLIYDYGEIKYELQMNACKYEENQLILQSDKDALFDAIQSM